MCGLPPRPPMPPIGRRQHDVTAMSRLLAHGGEAGLAVRPEGLRRPGRVRRADAVLHQITAQVAMTGGTNDHTTAASIASEAHTSQPDAAHEQWYRAARALHRAHLGGTISRRADSTKAICTIPDATPSMAAAETLLMSHLVLDWVCPGVCSGEGDLRRHVWSPWAAHSLGAGGVRTSAREWALKARRWTVAAPMSALCCWFRRSSRASSSPIFVWNSERILSALAPCGAAPQTCQELADTSLGRVGVGPCWGSVAFGRCLCDAFELIARAWPWCGTARKT